MEKKNKKTENKQCTSLDGDTRYICQRSRLDNPRSAGNVSLSFPSPLLSPSATNSRLLANSGRFINLRSNQGFSRSADRSGEKPQGRKVDGVSIRSRGRVSIFLPLLPRGTLARKKMALYSDPTRERSTLRFSASRGLHHYSAAQV